jgi:hypothetical protein
MSHFYTKTSPHWKQRKKLWIYPDWLPTHWNERG